MSRMMHENVSCDSCQRNNFPGKRYKCLICADYDLCEGCREQGDARHLPGHPMQCILTPFDLMLYLGDESGPALACPICGTLGHTELTLRTHLISTHSDQGTRKLMCPACALLPIRENSMLTEDLANHLLVGHSQREGEERHRDPIGELLSTLSKQGRQYRPSSTYSLLRPLQAASSSSGLSVRKVLPSPVLDSNADRKTEPRDNVFLLASVASEPHTQEELESEDEVTAARSIFTNNLMYSLLPKQDNSSLVTTFL